MMKPITTVGLDNGSVQPLGSTVEELLGSTKNGEFVYLDANSSHARTHFADMPYLKDYVIEALQNITATNGQEWVEVNLNQVIGESDLVQTSESDDIVYAKRINRDKYARFVKQRQPEPTTYVTIALRKRADGYYLYTAWLGEKMPPFPVGEHNTPENNAFWREHALVWGKQKIQKGSEVYEWPWD